MESEGKSANAEREGGKEGSGQAREILHRQNPLFGVLSPFGLL